MIDEAIHIPLTGSIYRHYKGGEYRVICVGRLSEQRDQICVVYMSLDRGHVWIRPIGMWSEPVDWPEFGEQGPRFMPHAEYAERQAAQQERGKEQLL